MAAIKDSRSLSANSSTKRLSTEPPPAASSRESATFFFSSTVSTGLRNMSASGRDSSTASPRAFRVAPYRSMSAMPDSLPRAKSAEA